MNIDEATRYADFCPQLPPIVQGCLNTISTNDFHSELTNQDVALTDAPILFTPEPIGGGQTFEP
jgi:hypothetical protein